MTEPTEGFDAEAGAQEFQHLSRQNEETLKVIAGRGFQVPPPMQRVAAALALAEEKAEIGAKTSCSLLLSLAREYRALAKVIGEAEKDGES